MPTTFTADADAAALAPDTGQGPESLPKLSLPNDGEAANVASIYQALKVLVNHLARAMRPKGSTSAATKYIQRWRTSLGHTRFAIDRIGLPAGTFMHRQEHWPITTALAGLPTDMLPLYPNSWIATAGPAADGVLLVAPAGFSSGAGIPNARIGVLHIRAGDTLNYFYGVRSTPICAYHDDADIAWENVLWLEDAVGATRPDIVAGLFDYTDSITDPRMAIGCYFYRDAAQANWQAIARDGVSETVVDTGVAATAGAFKRMRIEWRGSNANDGGVRTAYFFIAQALVATITTDLPGGGAACAGYFTKNVAGAAIVRPSGPSDMYIGPVNLACNLMPSVTTF